MGAPLDPQSAILWPAAAHLLLVFGLYGWLTLERFVAFVLLKRGRYNDLLASGSETGRAARVSANLTNQFEAPAFFHPLILLLFALGAADTLDLALAWLFFAGRVIHTLVQTLMTNVPLRGLVFSINYLALCGLWAHFFWRAASASLPGAL